MLIFLVRLDAQEPDEANPDKQKQEQAKEKAIDTTKLRISIKTLRNDMMSFDSIPFDTLLEDIHIQNQIYKKYVFVSHLGNLGLAIKSNNFFQQVSSNDLFIFNSISYNFIHQEDILYYKTNHAFSNISYNTSGTQDVELQSIRFIHTQNVNKKLNVGTLLNLHSSNGLYQHQQSTANALSLFSSYDGDYYNFNAVVSYNTLKNEENGGISSDSLFENDDEKASVYSTVFEDAKTDIKNTYFFISQRFNLAGLRRVIDKQDNDTVRKFSGIGLLHTLEYNRNKRSYSDASGPSNDLPYKYYSQFNNDSLSTNDSLYFVRLQNSLEIVLGKQNPNEPPILIRAGIKSIYDKYEYSYNTDTIVNTDETGVKDTSVVFHFSGNHYNNLAFTGGLSVGIKSFFLLNASADYFFTGYKAGDLYLHGILMNRFSKKSEALSYKILMDLSRYKPGYLLDKYSSNHFIWDNGFVPVKEVRVGIQINWPAVKFDADFNYSLLSSSVFFDSTAFPQQYAGEVSVIEGSISKGFDAGVFHTKMKAMVQVTSNDAIVPLPLFSAYNSSYVELKFFKIMTTQLGYDVRYNTSYYANGYMPDLGVFYNQRQKKIGDYPFVDVFLNVKLKRMRFYFKVEHVNYDFLSRTYYTTLHYPANSRMFIYGLSWNFYD